MSLSRKAEKTLKSECCIEENSSILVACSGGPDSVALLHFLHTSTSRLGIKRLGVYHLNHGLRGDQADADEEFVRKLSESLGLTSHIEKADVSGFAASHGLSLEMAGRKLRYAGLESILKSGMYDYAALGHTATDNVEWIIYSLVRGRTDPLLWGIPARRDQHIRPLIRVKRDEVLSYLSRHHLGFREDESNLDLSFVRNRIRHQVLPLLQTLNPSLEDTLGRSLELGERVKGSVDEESREILENLSKYKPQGSELDTSGLSRYNLATQLRVLRLFVPWLGAEELLRLLPLKRARGSVEIVAKKGIRLVHSYDRLVCTKGREQDIWKPLKLNNEVTIPELGWRIRLEEAFPSSMTYDRDKAFFDAEIIKPPLHVRPWREGDRIIPFARHRAVKIKRLFIDRKIPQSMRRLWPLVCKGEKVLWVVGLVRSADALISGATRRVALLTVEKENDLE